MTQFEKSPMIKMHADEFLINASMVKHLIDSQCPQWTHLPIQYVESSGTDNALFRLGSDYIIRLPRLDGGRPNIEKEWEWLPKLAPMLKTPISVPVYKGEPSQDYPYYWTIARWHEGRVPDFELNDDYEYLAKDLAFFINELHAIQLTDGPKSRRGVPLNTPALDLETRQATSQLQDEVDVDRVTELWNKLSQIRYWDNDPVWIHGDLLPGNILIQNQRLSAVIDFSDVGLGDPATDLIPAWCLFSARSRAIFKQHLKTLDENTWQRGKGRALSMALIILPYYKNTNKVLADIARKMIAQILEDTSDGI